MEAQSGRSETCAVFLSEFSLPQGVQGESGRPLRRILGVTVVVSARVRVGLWGGGWREREREREGFLACGCE